MSTDLPHNSRLSIVRTACRDLQAIAGIMIFMTGDGSDPIEPDAGVFLARSLEGIARNVERLQEALEMEGVS